MTLPLTLTARDPEAFQAVFSGVRVLKPSLFLLWHVNRISLQFGRWGGVTGTPRGSCRAASGDFSTACNFDDGFVFTMYSSLPGPSIVALHGKFTQLGPLCNC